MKDHQGQEARDKIKGLKSLFGGARIEGNRTEEGNLQEELVKLISLSGIMN